MGTFERWMVKMSMSDRRDFLKTLGISVPAALIATPTAAKEAEMANAVTPQEIFEIYVSESLTLLPHYFADAATDRHSVVRQLIEVQGAALATVLMYLQSNRDGNV